jgi:cation transport ATPase
MSQPAAGKQYELFLEDPRVFGTGCASAARLFARRILGVPELKALFVEPAASRARLAYQAIDGQRQSALSRLADAAQSDGHLLDEASMPMLPGDLPWLAVPRDDGILFLTIDDTQPDRWLLRHPWFRTAGQILDKRLTQTLRRVSGIHKVRLDSAAGQVEVVYSPARTNLFRMTRVLEQVLAQAPPPLVAQHSASVPMSLSNTTLGLSAVGELMLPLATPLVAGILIVRNVGTARDALNHLSHGKAGVSVARISLLACTLLTGQVVAAALTDWSLRYWQRRSRENLANETRRLLEETLLVPEKALSATADGNWQELPVTDVRAGDHIRSVAGEVIAVDGVVMQGEALVDESALSGARVPVRKSVGDRVLAGSKLLFGQLGVKVERSGSDTVAAGIVATIRSVANEFANDPTLKRSSGQITERAILPTLITAGVGFAGGGLTTMGPILRQDWISGPALAVPMVLLRMLSTALHSGVLVQRGAAIQELAQCDFIVFDGDDPLLTEPGLDLAGMECRLPDTDAMLQQVAGASLFLGDERCQALANACHEKGLVVQMPTLLAIEAGRVEVRFGQHVLRLSNGTAGPARGAPTLLVEIDGHEVAVLGFRQSAQPRAAQAVQRLRAAGLEIFLVSSASEPATNGLARRLGIELCGGELDEEGKIRFMMGLRRRGIHPLFVGCLEEKMKLAQAAHVSVASDGRNGKCAAGDMLILGRSYEGLVDLIEMARLYKPQIFSASRKALIPNLLCVAGGFGGVLNGIGANIIANIGVMNVDRQLRRDLARNEADRWPRLTQMLR